MDVQFRVQFQLGNAAQIFFQNGGFDLKLMLVVGVLIVASATALEIRTSRIDASRRGRENFLQLGASEPRLLFAKDCFHAFAGQDEGHKHSFAGAVFVGRKSRQTFSAVDQLFNCESQASILQGKSVWRTPAAAGSFVSAGSSQLQKTHDVYI